MHRSRNKIDRAPGSEITASNAFLAKEEEFIRQEIRLSRYGSTINMRLSLSIISRPVRLQ